MKGMDSMTNGIVPYSGDSRQPTTFNFGDQPIKVIPDHSNAPWFIASEVCKVLNISNVSQAVARLDDDEKSYMSDIYPSLGSNQLMINESGLYSLVLRSDRPEAKAFKKWVTSEVLPAIRKTGSYALQNLTPAQQLLVYAQQLVAQEQKLEQHEGRIEQLEARVHAHDEGSQYFTIIAYCNLRRLRPPITNDEALAYGRLCSKFSREHSYKTGKSSDARYGSVNTYHIEVLDAVFRGRGQQ